MTSGTFNTLGDVRRRNAARALAATAAAAAFVSVAGVPAYADTDPDTAIETNTVTVAVQDGITLSAVPDLSLGGLPGETATGDVAFNVITNSTAGYQVTVQSQADNLVADGANASTIPIEALQVDPDGTVGAAGFTSIPGPTALGDVEPVILHTQGTPSAAGGDALTNPYRLLIPSVPLDSYTVDLTYTASVL